MENGRRAAFAAKYKDGEKIWSGKSFVNFPELKGLLAELPVSAAGVPRRDYPNRDQGNLDFVFGELLYNLSGYEGYLKDNAGHLDGCWVRPVTGANAVILEFGIDYTTKAGGQETKSFEVLRLGEREYLLFAEKYRMS